MKPRQRQARILEAVAQQGETTVEALAAAFDVSAETIRRDLAQLARAGSLQKVHGGARRPPVLAEGPFADRMAEAAAAKAAIAARVAGLVQPGRTIFVDAGTTTLACAVALADTPGLTVITNSTRVARSLGRGSGRARVFLLGGAFAPDGEATLGARTVAEAAAFAADLALIGPAAVDASGATDADADEAELARMMVRNARAVIVAAHGAKIGRHAAFRICRLDEVAHLVTDEPPGDTFHAALTAAGVALG